MQRVAAELHTALSAHPDFNVTTLALETSWKWTYVNTPLFLARLFRDIPNAVALHPATVVLFSSMVTASIAPLLRAYKPTRRTVMVSMAHGRDVTLDVGVYQQWLPKVFSALDLLIPVSAATASASNQRGMSVSRTAVIPNGIDVGRFPIPVSREKGRQILLELLPALGRPFRDARMVVTSVGRHVERKGFDWFIQSVLPALPADVLYVIAGEGERTATIKEKAIRAGVANQVSFVGRLTERQLAALYAGSDLFVMPNVPVEGDMEGFGVVLLEAAMSGLPVVASSLEGIRDAITDGENGFLVEPKDSAGYVERIMALYEDLDFSRQSGLRARAFVQSKFDWTSIANEFRATLHEVTPRS